MASTSDSTNSRPSRVCKFHDGQVVWCSWKGWYYKARILYKIVEYDNFEQYYMIHFIKFSKSYDSGVAESKLLSCSMENNTIVKESNLMLRREIKKKRQMDKIKAELELDLKKPLSLQRQMRIDLCCLSFPMSRDVLINGDKINRQLSELKEKTTINKKLEVSKKTALEKPVKKKNVSKKNVSKKNVSKKNTQLFKGTVAKKRVPIQVSKNKDSISKYPDHDLVEKGFIRSSNIISSRLRSSTDATQFKDLKGKNSNKKSKVYSSSTKSKVASITNYKLNNRQIVTFKEENAVKKSTLQHLKKSKINFKDVNHSNDTDFVVENSSSFHQAHSSNYNPFETKANPPVLSSLSSTKIVQTKASSLKNIKSHKGGKSKEISSRHSKIHSEHKIKRKLKGINLYLDEDDVIGSRRLVCGEYKYASSNTINLNGSIPCVTTSIKEDNLRSLDKLQSSYNSIDNKLVNDNFEKVVTNFITEEHLKLNDQPDIKMDYSVCATSTENNHYYEEVTSESETQIKLDDQDVHVVDPKNGFLIDDSNCEVHASPNLTECNPTEITINNLATEESYLENNFEDESSANDNDHCNIEVTTSEPVEQLKNNQENNINAKDCSIIQESSCVVYNTSKIANNYSLEKNENVATEGFDPKTNLDDENIYSKNVQNNQNDIVTTTKLEEHLQKIIHHETSNLKDGSGTDENVGEVHTISSLKIINPSKTPHSIITTDESHPESNLDYERHSTDENDSLKENETISQPEEQLDLNDKQDFIVTDSSVSDESSYKAHDNPNFEECNSSNRDVSIITEEACCDAIKNVEIYSTDALVDHFNDEVTTSVSKEQLILGDKDVFVDSRSSSVCDTSICETHDNINLNECNSSEITNAKLATDESYSETYLTDERRSIDVENNYFEEEVTTSKPEEHSTIEGKQQDFINSEDYPMENIISHCRAVQSFITSLSQSPICISSFSIVTSVSDLEKNFNTNESDPINETSSSGNTSLIFTTALLNGNQKFDDCEKKENASGPKSNIPIKLENVIDPGSNLSNNPDCEINDISKLKPNDTMSRNVSLIVTTEDLPKTINLNDTDKNTIDENKKSKESNVSIKFENEVGVKPLIVPEDNLVGKNHLDIASNESFSTNKMINSEVVSSTSSIAAMNKKKKTYDNEVVTTHDDINLKKSKASSSKSTTVSHNKKKSFDNKGNCHVEKVKASSSTLILQKETNNHEVKCTKDDSIRKSEAHKKHKKKKSKDLHKMNISVADHQLRNDCAKKLKVNQENKATKGKIKSKKVKSLAKTKNVSDIVKKFEDLKERIEKGKIHKKLEKEKLKDSNHKKEDPIINDCQLDHVSNNNCNEKQSKISNSSTKIEPKAKKVHDLENESSNNHVSNNNCNEKQSKISNSSTKIEPKAKKVHDLENESSNKEHQVQKGKVHKEVHKNLDKNVLKDVDIFSIEDNVVGNYNIEPASNDNLNINKRKYFKMVNSLSTNKKTKKKEIHDGDFKISKNHTNESNNVEPKSKDLDVNQDLDLVPSSNYHVNKKNHSGVVSNSSSSANLVPNRKICFDVENESSYDQVKKLKEDEINEKKKLSDEEFKAIRDNIVRQLDEHDKQVEDVLVIHKETSTFVDKDFDKDNVDDYQLSSKTDKHHTSNENLSNESSSSTTSNHIIESDDDNDGQTTDDDQYVKNRKVIKNKRVIDDEDRNIFKQFGSEKPYSRAAKVKATEAISSQMKKPPSGKEKKNDGKRSKNGRKKDEEDPPSTCTKLSDYNLTLTRYAKIMLIEDKILTENERLMVIVPARLTVNMILHDYASKNEVGKDILEQVLESFDLTIRIWLLNFLERPKYDKVMGEHPGKKANEIYGLPHLLRFIIKLPRLFEVWGDIDHSFIPDVIKFIEGLLVYLDKERFTLTLADYDCIMPDYFRLALNYY